MKTLKKILSILFLLFCFGINAQAEKPKTIMIIDGYFFNNMPVSRTDIARMHILNTPSGNSAIGIELKSPLPEDAIKYAMPIEQVNEAALLLELYNESVIKAKGLEVSLSKKSVINVGDKFPEFSASDINGKIWTNADVKGKVMVLNLWFTGCRPCRAEMPELSKWKDEMPDVMFFSATYEDVKRAKPVIEKQGFNWIALINDTQFSKFIGGNGYPMTVVVDKSGIVKKVEYGTSQIQLSELKKCIQSLRF